MYVSEHDVKFNDLMRRADVVGCAYGLSPYEGYPGPVPTLSIIARNELELRQAFQCLERWGAHEDPDIINVSLQLNADGSYVLGIGRDLERAVHRLVGYSELVDFLFTSVTWFKPIDTTSPWIRQLKEHSEDNRFAPVLLGGAVLSKGHTAPNTSNLQFPSELPTFLKFNIRIFDAAGTENDVTMAISGHRDRVKGNPNVRTPGDVAHARRRILRTLFPVTRIRAQRSGLIAEVRKSNGFARVVDDQIVQSIANTLLSRELTSGNDHFHGVGDIRLAVISASKTRIETADGSDLVRALSPVVLCEQLRRDVDHVLQSHGMTLRESFSRNQDEFLRLGYGR